MVSIVSREPGAGPYPSPREAGWTAPGSRLPKTATGTTLMAKITLACQFCQTLNAIDPDRHADKPKCSECGRPFLLDRPVGYLCVELSHAHPPA